MLIGPSAGPVGAPPVGRKTVDTDLAGIRAGSLFWGTVAGGPGTGGAGEKWRDPLKANCELKIEI